jgi:uncharacterized protein DUF6847
MKLAEALIQRADAQKRIEQLKARLIQNAKIQEGDAPAENPPALIEELERAASELTALIQRINRTNSRTAFDGQGTLADALAVRDVLSLRHRFYRELAQAATIQQDRYSRSEVRFVRAVDVAAIQRQADALAQEHRALDTRIQEANWTTDLLE